MFFQRLRTSSRSRAHFCLVHAARRVVRGPRTFLQNHELTHSHAPLSGVAPQLGSMMYQHGGRARLPPRGRFGVRLRGTHRGRVERMGFAVAARPSRAGRRFAARLGLGHSVGARALPSTGSASVLTAVVLLGALEASRDGFRRGKILVGFVRTAGLARTLRTLGGRRSQRGQHTKRTLVA